MVTSRTVLLIDSEGSQLAPIRPQPRASPKQNFNPRLLLSWARQQPRIRMQSQRCSASMPQHLYLRSMSDSHGRNPPSVIIGIIWFVSEVPSHCALATQIAPKTLPTD